MAEAVAAQLVGEEAQFTGADMSTKLRLLGWIVGSIGDAHGAAPGPCPLSSAMAAKPATAHSHQCRRQQLLGAVLVGDCPDYDTLLQYHLNNIELPPDPQGLIVPTVGDRPLLGGAPCRPPPPSVPATTLPGDVVSALDSGCCSW